MSEAEDPEDEDQELFEHFNIIADKGQEPLRVDKFLMDRIPNTSRTKINDAAADGYVHVNKIAVKANYKVKPLDEVSVVLPYPQRELKLIPQDLPLEILYEDDTLIIINKAPNMVVHPGFGNYTGTMVNALVYHFDNLPESQGDQPHRPGLVHRLDKNTTGVMVVAKTERALTDLSRQFFERTIDRRYVAIAWGDIQEDGEIEGHLGRSLKNRKLMTVFPEADYGKHAHTRYKVLERLNYITVVECKLETGRTHQIRAHFKHIGHPLFNDPEYGGNKILKGTTFSKYRQFVVNNFDILQRQALHARVLEITHPVTRERMRFEAPLPDDMEKVLERWRAYISTRNDA